MRPAKDAFSKLEKVVFVDSPTLDMLETTGAVRHAFAISPASQFALPPSKLNDFQALFRLGSKEVCRSTCHTSIVPLRNVECISRFR